MKAFSALPLALLLAFGSAAGAQEPPAPRLEQFTSDNATIEARVFVPEGGSRSPRPVVVLFHGGGWNEGEAEWMDSVAAQYLRVGAVAVSVDYRLSKDGVTPFDAVSDARNAIRWLRSEATRLGIDPQRVIALGTSAGAHLAASTAIFDEPWASPYSSVPNALVLRSPALSVERSGWFRTLSGGRAQASALSPTLHIRKGLPPMLVLQGEMDNVTPAAEAKLFCERMQQRGNTCELTIYPGVGHLFTRNLANQEIPDYSAIDATITQAAGEAGIAFLRRHGLIAAADAR